MYNLDIINPEKSCNKLAGLTLPKVMLNLLPPDRWYLPTLAISYGEAFHTEVPRIGNRHRTTYFAIALACSSACALQGDQTDATLCYASCASNSQELATKTQTEFDWRS